MEEESPRFRSIGARHAVSTGRPAVETTHTPSEPRASASGPAMACVNGPLRPKAANQHRDPWHGDRSPKRRQKGFDLERVGSDGGVSQRDAKVR